MSDTHIDKVGILNQGNAVNLGTQIGEQHNYAPEQRQTLAEAAKDIQNLLDQLAETYPTETPSQKAVVGAKALEAIEQNPTLRSRVVGALKAGGVMALEEIVDNPLFNVMSASLEGFIDP
ncbi:MAG: hypothetical protein AAFY57_11705 [Cyanobacteria bacterium J06642_2]